ncbi:MAG TPA: CHASE domain-containing protein [Phycisphaerales bacterium]|nr:CHASE domain-containing protein [Phycisphaerales bacterium]
MSGDDPIPPRARRLWVPWAILAGSTLTAALAALLVHRAAVLKDRVRFTAAVERAEHRLTDRLERYVALLRGGAGLLSARPDVTAAEFAAYVNHLNLAELYPGIQGIGWAVRTEPGELEALEQRGRAEVTPDFAVRPTGARDVHFPILFLEPRDRRNLQALGYDMFSEEVRREAMTRALRSARPALSGRVTLVQEIDADVQAGFLVYVPVYRGTTLPPPERRHEDIRGFVYSPFRAEDLLRGVFSGEPGEIALWVYDGEGADPARLMHDGAAGGGGAVPGGLAAVTTTHIMGRTWTLDFRATPAFAAGSDRRSAPAVLLAGLMIGGALFAVSRAETLSRRAAEESARQLGASRAEVGRSREQLARYSDHLEELVEARSQALEASSRRLRLSERMAAIGTLSAGIGHDMGNLLLPIRLRLDMLAGHDLGPETREHLEAMRQSVDYLQTLTNGLRLLALDPEDRGASGGQTELGAWWRETAGLFKNAVGKGVGLDADLPAALPAVALPPHQLTQAVLNLVTNAGDAVRAAGREGGTVRLWAAAGAGSTVRIGVTDDGTGMTEEVRARALEPFYTTKTRRLSTGLGLSLVHGIVTSAAGELAIETEPGRGTTVTLTLPAARAPDAAARGPALPRVAAVSVVDARFRAYLGALLEPMGFAVRAEAAPIDPEVAVWVVDGASLGGWDVPRVAGSRPELRVVTIGLGMPAARNVVSLPADARPTQVARALRAAPGPGLDGAAI